MKRLLAIGLDAAPGELLDELIAEGRLPHLAGLARGAGRVTVTNPEDYRAELPWTGFWSGRGPAANDYWGTVRFDPGTYGATEAGALRSEPFYARVGRPVLVVDLPHCAPWPGLSGAQVAAWGAHSPQVPRSSWPGGLITRLDRLVGPHPAFEADSQPGWHSPPYLDALTDALVVGAARRAEAVRWLAAQVPDWALALVVFSETHSAGHHLWHGVDRAHPLHGAAGPGSVGGSAARRPAPGPGSVAGPAARRRLVRIYAAVDAAVGRVLSLADADTVVAVFSVHGMRANANDLPALHLVPELLHRLHGFPPRLVGCWGRVDEPPRVPGARKAVGDVVEAGLHRSPPQQARRALRRARARLGGRRPPWYRLDGRPPPESPADESLAERPLHYLGTDEYRAGWPHQRIFALPTFSDTHLRLNLVGRERHGVVPPEARQAELDHWAAQLAACRDPRRGRPVALTFGRPGPVGAGGGGPPADLVVRFEEPLDALDHPRAGRIGPVPFLRTGEHDRYGFLLVRGAERLGLPARRLPVEALGDLLVNLPGLRARP